MYTFDWKPEPKQISIPKEDGTIEMKTIVPAFEGTVKVKVPKHTDRIKVLRDINTSVSSTGALENVGIDSAEKLMNFAKSNIESVDLKRISDGLVVNKVDWLEYDIDGADILSDISNILIQGVRLGKS